MTIIGTKVNVAWVWCARCNKRTYHSRRDAKAVARSHRQASDRHIRAYECPEGRGWHVGHYPEVVAAGLISADEAALTSRSDS